MFKSTLSSFSNLLVENWSPEFLESSTITFRANTKIALNNFSTFKMSYEKAISKFFNENFPDPAEARRKQLWIAEQINLALDLFWEPLARVAEQLKSEPYQEFFSTTSKLGDVLEEFKSNTDDLFGESTRNLVDKILIYFDKTTRIHRYPYTDIAMIGIPYRVLTDDPKKRKTWMPIVHELGHHIYWNMAGYFDLEAQKKAFEKGILDRQKNHHSLPDNIRNLIKPWMEEIFVDAVATRISGKGDVERQEFLASSKELILRKSDNEKTNLSIDDGDHVPDGLRLLVSLTSLGASDPIAEWKSFLQDDVGKKPDEIEFDLKDENGDFVSNKIKATEVAEHICNTVNLILTDIGEYKKGNESLFKIQTSQSTPTEIANKLLETAIKQGNNNPMDILAIVLSPEVLEGGAGGTSHTHKRVWQSANGHTHSDSATHVG